MLLIARSGIKAPKRMLFLLSRVFLRTVMGLCLLLLLLAPFQAVVAAPSSPDPFSHSDLNAWWNPPPFASGFVAGAKVVDVSRSAVYAHDGSTASTIAAIRRAISEGVDLIRLDLSCAEIQRDLPLASTVLQARLRGTVVICEGGPNPKFVQVVAGGPPKSITFTTTGGIHAGEEYSSKVEIFSPDLRVYVLPSSFRSGLMNKKVSVTVLALNSESRGERQPSWHEARVVWTSSGEGVIAAEWLFIISVKSATNP